MMAAAPERPQNFAPLLALFLIVLGIKLATISAFGSAVPYTDEWDAGAAGLYGPYGNGTLSLWSLLSPHNEHRILTSRLLGLAMFELAGGWDPLLQMFLNGLIHAVFCVGFVAMLAGIVPAERRMTLIIFSAVVLAIPFGVENLLLGMNAHFYLLMIFAVLAIYAQVRHRSFSVPWLLGLAAVVASYFSMASGAVTPFAILIVHVVQMALRSRQRSPREFAGAAVLVGLGAALLAFIPHIAQNEIYKAHSIGQFLGALISVSSLPLATILGTIVVHLPIFLFAWRTLRSRADLSATSWAVLGIAVWVAAQMASMAYSRAPQIMSSRYLDVIIIIAPVNCAALLALPLTRRFARGAASAWVFLLLLASIEAAWFFTAPTLAGYKGSLITQQANLTQYLAGGDVAAFQQNNKLYPSSSRLIALLADPAIRAILPEDVRPADVDTKGVVEHTLLKGVAAGAMQTIKNLFLRLGPVLAGAGFALLLVAIFRRDLKRADAGGGPART